MDKNNSFSFLQFFRINISLLWDLHYCFLWIAKFMHSHFHGTLPRCFAPLFQEELTIDKMDRRTLDALCRIFKANPGTHLTKHIERKWFFQIKAFFITWEITVIQIAAPQELEKATKSIITKKVNVCIYGRCFIRLRF